MFVQYLCGLNIKFVQYYVYVNVPKSKKLLICKFVNIFM